MVDKLVISFGARRYSEVLDTALSRQDLQNSERNISLKGWLISRLNTILNLDVEPNGGSFTDTEHPLIYINIGQIRDEEELNRVWDHETAHLIYRVDPDKRESSWESILEAAAIQASIMTLASVAATTSVYLKLSRTKGVDIKTLIKEDEEKFKKRIIRAMKLQFVPSLLLSPHESKRDDSQNSQSANDHPSYGWKTCHLESPHSIIFSVTLVRCSDVSFLAIVRSSYPSYSSLQPSQAAYDPPKCYFSNKSKYFGYSKLRWRNSIPKLESDSEIPTWGVERAYT